MKKILLVLILIGFLFNSVSAFTTIDELRNQIKMTLAQREPNITDAILNDFIILALQSVAENALAFRSHGAVSATSSSNNYSFLKTTEFSGYAEGQGLFVGGANKGVNTTTHRSVWEINPSDLGQKWLINPPAYQYFYIWHDVDSSVFSFYDPASGNVTIDYYFYYVPTTFYDADGGVYMPSYFNDVVIELALFFCYTRLKDWNSAFMCWDKYRENMQIIREFHVNKQPMESFGPQEIDR